MKDVIKDLGLDEILKIIDDQDVRHSYERIKKVPNDFELRSSLLKHLQHVNFGQKAVLGVDIRNYGSFDDFIQPLIPVIYEILFEEAILLSEVNQEFIFQHYDKESVKANTISTGDGGFIIFDTPLHALLFACSFAITLRLYNSYHLYPKLRSATGELNLRYSITYDRIYGIGNNFFGRAIINNSRIISKDTLNRCLIDEGSYQWFLLNIDGLENLQVMNINEIAYIEEFQDYDHRLLHDGVNTFFEEKGDTRNFGIINSDLLKIGIIESKNTILNVYNVHIQVSLVMNPQSDDEKRTITVSLGNLNTTGI